MELSVLLEEAAKQRVDNDKPNNGSEVEETIQRESYGGVFTQWCHRVRTSKIVAAASYPTSSEH